MITLSEAFKLCQIREESLVCLKSMGIAKSKNHYFRAATIRNRFDMEKINVACIRPKFAPHSPDFECMKFVVTGISEDKLREEEYRE